MPSNYFYVSVSNLLRQANMGMQSRDDDHFKLAIQLQKQAGLSTKNIGLSRPYEYIPENKSIIDILQSECDNWIKDIK